MDLVVYDDDEKRYVPWAVALAGALLVAVLAAVLAFVLARTTGGDDEAAALAGATAPEPASAPSESAMSEPDASDTATATDPAAGAAQPAGCPEALTRADAALARGETLTEFLAQHTQIMDELLAERLTRESALDQTLPVLTDGATERKRFAEDLAAYEQARAQCPS